jgi:hypothetical protein
VEMAIVLVLTAGVCALLVWFETDSRRNEARMKHGPKVFPAASGLEKEGECGVRAKTERRKAA